MIAVTACALGLVGASSAAAGTPPVGGAAAPQAPTIRDAICISSCVGLRSATVGSVIQVSGSDLASVDRMTFEGKSGRIVAPVRSPTDTAVEAKVPKGAVSGQVLVRDAFGNNSRLSPSELEIKPTSALVDAGTLTVTEAETTPTTAYFFGVKSPQLTYIISSNKPTNDLRIDVVDENGGVVRSYFRKAVPTNSTQSVKWDGNTTAKQPAPNGSYSFRISSSSGEPAKFSGRARRSALDFDLYGYIFPVRGPHTYGDGIGAPRAGHTHLGQDVLTNCGVPLVAARGGTVQYNAYQGAAGNYIVIDGKATGQDFMYAHLIAPSPLKVGSVVKTGQLIGHVGQTGDATACHLHFEIWSAPGWYEGGHFLDPAPPLKRWDHYS